MDSKVIFKNNQIIKPEIPNYEDLIAYWNFGIYDSGDIRQLLFRSKESVLESAFGNERFFNKTNEKPLSQFYFNIDFPSLFNVVKKKRDTVFNSQKGEGFTENDMPINFKVCDDYFENENDTIDDSLFEDGGLLLRKNNYLNGIYFFIFNAFQLKGNRITLGITDGASFPIKHLKKQYTITTKLKIKFPNIEEYFSDSEDSKKRLRIIRFAKEGTVICIDIKKIKNKISFIIGEEEGIRKGKFGIAIGKELLLEEEILNLEVLNNKEYEITFVETENVDPSATSRTIKNISIDINGEKVERAFDDIDKNDNAYIRERLMISTNSLWKFVLDGLGEQTYDPDSGFPLIENEDGVDIAIKEIGMWIKATRYKKEEEFFDDSLPLPPPLPPIF